MSIDIPREIGQLQLVPIDQVLVESNVRTDLGDLDELAASIKAVGLLEPIVVHAGSSLVDGKRLYFVDHGHRRLAACALAGLADIPAIIRTEPAGVARPIDQLVDNIQRADLNPLEEAAAFRGILAADPELTQKALAERIGRSAPYVSNALRLLELEPTVRAMAADGQISGAHAKALAGLKGKAQVEAAEKAIRFRYSSHQLEDELTRERKWAEQQKEREAATAESVRGRYEKGVAALAKKKVPPDAPIFVPESNYYGSLAAQPMVNHAQAAGYKNIKKGSCESRAGTLGCDCIVWLIDLTSDPPKVVPGCVKPEHRLAKTEADHEAYLVQEAQRTRVKARLEEVLLTDAAQTSRLVGRLALWMALSWRIDDWAKNRNAAAAIKGEKPPKRTAWQTIASLTNEELGQELAKVLAAELRDQFNLKVDWEAFEAELAPPPEPISPAEAAERVAVKRAARRAGVET
jgi:ParB family chromosome partitioning protein